MKSVRTLGLVYAAHIRAQHAVMVLCIHPDQSDASEPSAVRLEWCVLMSRQAVISLLTKRTYPLLLAKVMPIQ